jgi:hypothetical protein
VSTHRLLTILLRFGGVLLSSAAFFIFMPHEMMASANARLGLAPLPDQPLTEYLTRSLSARYALHGAILLLASTDVVRYRPLIILLGIGNILFGALMLAIDAAAGMPRWWTLSEGPLILLVGCLTTVLALRLPRGVAQADARAL